jgi:hypothetical protein
VIFFPIFARKSAVATPVIPRPTMRTSSGKFTVNNLRLFGAGFEAYTEAFRAFPLTSVL